MTKRYGLIGAGMMGQEHMRSLAFVAGADLVAVAEPNAEPQGWTRNTLSQLPYTPTLYEDWREMIAAESLDAVIVSTPNHTHYAVLDALIQTDIAIMVEKPMCTTVERARDIHARARRRSALTHVGLEYRYMPPVARWLDRIPEVGTPVMLSIVEHRFPFLKKVGDWNRFNANTGGTLVEKCCHFFDLMRLALRSEPTRIYASAGTDVNHLDERYGGRVPDILDNAFVIVDFASGARASLDLCMFAEGEAEQERISVVGERAKLGVTIPSGDITLSPRDPVGPLTQHVPVDPNILAAGSHHGATVHHLRDFHRALVTGAPAPVTTLDGLRSVEMGAAAQVSAATGQSVDIAPPPE